jgi:hypothetical protein
MTGAEAVHLRSVPQSDGVHAYGCVLAHPCRCCCLPNHCCRTRRFRLVRLQVSRCDVWMLSKAVHVTCDRHVTYCCDVWMLSKAVQVMCDHHVTYRCDVWMLSKQYTSCATVTWLIAVMCECCQKQYRSCVTVTWLTVVSCILHSKVIQNETVMYHELVPPVSAYHVAIPVRLPS